MAEEKKDARPTTTAPSLLSASPAARGEADSSRILAALEGRAPEAEVKHLATPRRSRARRWTALALLLALVAGGVAWVIHEDGTAPMLAQAPAAAPAPAPAPAPAVTPPQASLSASSAAGDNPLRALEAPPAVASIVDEAPPARDANVGRGEPDPLGEPTNPLSVLAMSQPPAAAPAPGPTRQAAELRAQQGNATRAAKPAAATPRKSAKPADTDAALLSALMNYGLPPASPPGTRVYKSEGVFMREMPGSPLSERLKECRRLSFIESEQCRLRVCAGQWGTAVECPTPQANIEP
ncbi:hypothetical protein [Achromobacter arsenitoxydans]|uniref:Uncharacterized protein n=1 Tax=Achromobacter arsenitoxydans SY8 TaxID=477184 RepID=H0F3B4_9BURK|nr:hypothetical protein [Achromobacter arsenitoxydans]EHK67168.1 hypothetical protein KYC_06270 [Achromobacter arsenitoxydans SY8]